MLIEAFHLSVAGSENRMAQRAALAGKYTPRDKLGQSTASALHSQNWAEQQCSRLQSRSRLFQKY